MVKNVTRIKAEITINAKMHKYIICMKNIILGILLRAVVKMINMWEILLTIH